VLKLIVVRATLQRSLGTVEGNRTHIGGPGKGAGARVVLSALSGGVGRELDDEVSVEGCADSLQQWDRGNHPAGFQA
jgi:hypothetical protein